MSLEAFALGAGGAAAVVTAVGQVVRRTADSANRYLRTEIHEQTAGQTKLLTSRISRYEARTSAVFTAALGAAAGAGLVALVLLVRSNRRALSDAGLIGGQRPGPRP